MTTRAFSAEDLLAGACLLNDDVRHTVWTRGVTPDEFQSTQLHDLMTILSDMDHLDLPVEPVAIRRHAGTQGKDIDTDWLHDLRQAAVENPRVVDSCGYYIDLVQENARRVRAVKAAQGVVEEYQRDPTLDIQDQLARALMQIQSPQRDVKGGWLSDLLPAYLDDVQDNWAERNAPRFIPTGIAGVDKLLRGGVRPGELVTIGARPGMGKTALALYLANEAARQGKRVLVFSAEMTANALLRRASAEFANVPAPLIDKRGPAGHPKLEEQRDRYLRTIQADMIHLPVYIDDTSRPSVAYMLDKAKRLGDIDMVIFDYLGLANDGLGERASANEKMSKVSNDLMMMAKELDVPVVALSQLSRAVEQNKPFIPTLSHLRDSGLIEANSHIVILLYRRSYYVQQQMLEDDENPDYLDLFIAKNREGLTGMARTVFNGATFSITEK